MSITLRIIESMIFFMAFLFFFFCTQKTTAHRRYVDDVPIEVKHARQQEMSKAFRHSADVLHRGFIGREQLILIEGASKKSDQNYFGRNDANIKVIVPRISIPVGAAMAPDANCHTKIIEPGDFVVAKVTESNSQVLKGIPLYHTTISSYAAMQKIT